MINIKTKGPTVNLDVNPVFEKAVPVLKTAWIMLGLECVVTSGKDGEHSKKTAHKDGNALDLRTWDIQKHMMPLAFARNLSNALLQVCGPVFYVVLERDHIHLEYSEGIPNIKGWQKGKYFYDGTGK